MADLTYENLMAARQESKQTEEGFDVIKMANVALRILEQVNQIKGTGGNPTMVSRSQEDGSQAMVQKSNLDVNQILGTLTTVKSLKGDIKLSELETLIKEHKDQIEMMLEKV